MGPTAAFPAVDAHPISSVSPGTAFFQAQPGHGNKSVTCCRCVKAVKFVKAQKVTLITFTGLSCPLCLLVRFSNASSSPLRLEPLVALPRFWSFPTHPETHRITQGLGFRTWGFGSRVKGCKCPGTEEVGLGLCLLLHPRHSSPSSQLRRFRVQVSSVKFFGFSPASYHTFVPASPACCCCGELGGAVGRLQSLWHSGVVSRHPSGRQSLSIAAI